MSDFRQTITKPVCEQTACTITLSLTDQANVMVPKAQLTTVTATLYPRDDPTAFINSRNAQTILDANGGTIAADGTLTLVLGNDDNVLTDQENPEELHVLMVGWTWETGTRRGVKEITYRVVNQAQLA